METPCRPSSVVSRAASRTEEMGLSPLCPSTLHSDTTNDDQHKHSYQTHRRVSTCLPSALSSCCEISAGLTSAPAGLPPNVTLPSPGPPSS